MMDLGQRIVLEARKYLGTPFHHHGRLRGVGIDCLGLILQVMDFVGLIGEDSNCYGRMPTPENGAFLIERLSAHMAEVSVDEMRDGDVLVFWVLKRGLPQHVGIKTDIGMLHAFAKGRQKVTEHGIDRKWSKRITHVFRPVIAGEK